MLRCNCPSPGRSAARQTWPPGGGCWPLVMDACQDPRRAAPSGVKSERARRCSHRRRVRRNCRAAVPRRGRTPPGSASAAPLLRTRNCRARFRDHRRESDGRLRAVAPARRGCCRVATRSSRDCDFSNDAREDLSTFGVLGPFMSFDGRPVAMSAHGPLRSAGAEKTGLSVPTIALTLKKYR